MEKRKMQTKGAGKTEPKTGSAGSGCEGNSSRMAKIQRMYDEMGLDPKEVQRVYRRESPPAKEESPYTLRWYTDERDIEADEAWEKRNA